MPSREGDELFAQNDEARVLELSRIRGRLEKLSTLSSRARSADSVSTLSQAQNGGRMDVEGAASLLRGMEVDRDRFETHVGVQGRRPHDSAFLRLWARDQPRHVATIATPGDRWFEVEISGFGSSGTTYLYGHTADLSTDQDVREYVEELLGIALSTWTPQARLERRGLLRRDHLVVEVPGHRRFVLRPYSRA